LQSISHDIDPVSIFAGRNESPEPEVLYLQRSLEKPQPLACQHEGLNDQAPRHHRTAWKMIRVDPIAGIKAK